MRWPPPALVGAAPGSPWRPSGYCETLTSSHRRPSAVAAAPIGHDRDPFAPEAVAFRAGVIGCCAWQSLAGLPTCVVRVRFDPNGLPIGLQFTARHGGDGVALEAAALAMRLTADSQDQWPSPGVREQLP